MYSKNKVKSKGEKINVWVALFMCIFIYLLPFITYLHIDHLDSFEKKYFSSESGSIVDWFLYSKEIAVIIFSILLLFIFVEQRYFGYDRKVDYPLKHKVFRIPLILCGVYAGLLVLSGLFSKHKSVVMLGVVKQYEGLLGVLGYLVIFLAAINYFHHKKAIRYFTNLIILLSGTAAFYAIMEYKGHPLQEMKFMKYFITSKADRFYATKLHSVSENVHITFFNANYFGGFCGLMFPITFALSLGSRNMVKKVTGLICSAGIVIGAILSHSSGGLYSIIISTVVLLMVYLFYWYKKMVDRKQAVVLTVAILLCSVIGLKYMMSENDDFETRLNKVVRNEAMEYDSESLEQSLGDSHFVLKNIRTVSQSIYFTDENDNVIEVLAYKNENGEYYVLFLDGNGNQLKTEYRDYIYYFHDERYKNCNFKFSVTDKLYCDFGYASKLIFQFEDNRFKPYVHNMYTMEKITTYTGPEFFQNRLKLASGRGLIWGSTISILPKCIFLGFGNGNFVANYPQYDYVSLLEVYQTPAMVINKPHSWYLGIATDSGIVSLMAVLGLLFTFLVKGVKKCIIHPVKDEYLHMRVGVFISVMAYMVVGLVNDSFVCVSPVFWFIFGVGWYVISGEEILE